MNLYTAIQTIMKAHGGQFRKLGGDPYSIHPIEVALILSTLGADETVVIAGLFHDVVEDTAWCIDDVRNQCGQGVAELVYFCTEHDKSIAWKIRKQEMIDKVRLSGNTDAKLIVLADKLSNLRSIERALAELEENTLWSYFNSPKEEQRWYYIEMVRALSDLETNTGCKKYIIELKMLVEKIFEVDLNKPV